MILKDMPSYQSLLGRKARYPSMDVGLAEAYLHVWRTGAILNQTLDRLLTAHGVSLGRFVLLAILSREAEAIPVCALARHAGVTTPTVSAVISGMVRDGLVERLEEPSDRRVVRIRMLQAGQEALDKVFPAIFEHHKTALAGLSGEELRILISLLAKVRLDGGNGSSER